MTGFSSPRVFLKLIVFRGGVLVGSFSLSSGLYFSEVWCGSTIMVV